MALTKRQKQVLDFIAGFVEKLRNTPDGDGTLLDHSLLLYGSGIGNPNVHDHTNLPILVGLQIWLQGLAWPPTLPPSWRPISQETSSSASTIRVS